MKALSNWKFWIILSMASFIMVRCHPVSAQTTQIITPDGKLVTCIQNGQLITCF